MCGMRPRSMQKKGTGSLRFPFGLIWLYCAAASSMASSTVRSMYSPSGMEVWSS